MTSKKPTTKKATKKAKKTNRTKKTSPSQSKRRNILVTGYPGFIGKHLVKKLIKNEPQSKFNLLVKEKFVKEAEKLVRALRPKKDQVKILVGDIAGMHLGLSSSELKTLTSKVTDIYHLAAISYLGVTKEMMWRVNVQGTSNLLELAEEAPRLKRFNHFSTCYVSGNRQGVISEDELSEGQHFRNEYESTKYEAELLVNKYMDRLPITIYRPSIVVGNSKTGEIGRFDGPYYMRLLVATAPRSAPWPLPGKGCAPLNMVPVDYAIDAIYHLSLHPKAANSTFHIVDPNPLSARKVYELVSDRSGKKPSKLHFGAGLTKTILRLPGLEKISRAHRQALDYVNTMAIYNSTNTDQLLRGTDISCPQFHTYVDKLLGFVQTKYKNQRAKEEQLSDPLA
jgi:thioester reductase-like protein